MFSRICNKIKNIWNQVKQEERDREIREQEERERKNRFCWGLFKL